MDNATPAVSTVPLKTDNAVSSGLDPEVITDVQSTDDAVADQPPVLEAVRETAVNIQSTDGNVVERVSVYKLLGVTVQ